MSFRSIIKIAAVTLLVCWGVSAKSSIVPPAPESAGAVFKAAHVYNTIIDKAPYLTQASVTVSRTECLAIRDGI
ncbi:hypothetical protein FIBSPDRAFT_847152, partial [Athelia psychrophila]